MILHEIFHVYSITFPRYTFHVLSRKVDFLWDSVYCTYSTSPQNGLFELRLHGFQKRKSIACGKFYIQYSWSAKCHLWTQAAFQKLKKLATRYDTPAKWCSRFSKKQVLKSFTWGIFTGSQDGVPRYKLRIFYRPEVFKILRI